MKKTTLTLGEIYTLETEIAGSVNQQTGEKILTGLLNQKISLLQKYWLTEFVESLQSIKKTVDKLRDDLILKYGEKTEQGNFSIPVTLEKKDKKGKAVLDKEGNPIRELNPKFQEFNNEMNVLLQETREIEHYPFTIENFEKIETEESYTVFFKTLSKNNTTSAS